jgi:SRSO17 transposase
VPDEVTFATRPRLAPRMLARALTTGIRVPWVTGDEVDGRDPRLRCWLEEKRQSSVLALRSHERVWMRTGARLRPVTVAQVVATIPRGHW